MERSYQWSYQLPAKWVKYRLVYFFLVENNSPVAITAIPTNTNNTTSIPTGSEVFLELIS